MTEKKQEILAQLEQGKITANEAFTMLNQLNEPTTHPKQEAEFHNNDAPRSNGPERHSYHSPPPPQPSQHWLGGIMEEVGGAIESVVESIKDSDIGASISDFVHGTYGNHENTLHFTSNPISQGITKLGMIGKNARVSVSGYEGSVIQVKCKYNARRPDAEVLFQEENGVYQIMYDEKLIRSMEITCHVPNVMIKNIHAASKNGAVSLENIQAGAVVLYTKTDKILAYNVNCAEFIAQTRNDTVKVESLTAQNIHIETTNSKIQVEGVRANNAELRTTNSSIKTAFMDVDNLILNTTNSSIKLDKLMETVGDWSGERIIEANTTNSNISFPVRSDIGIKLQAHAPGGKVTCKNYDMYFSEHGRTHAQGTSRNYEFGSKKLYVRLSTTNGSVKVR